MVRFGFVRKLFRIHYQETSQLYVRFHRGEKKIVHKILLVLLFLLILCSFGFLTFINAFNTISVAVNHSLLTEALCTIYFTSSFILFLLIALRMDTFLYGGENTLFFTWPLSEEELFLTRFLFVYGYGLLVNAVLLIPVFIAVFLFIDVTILSMVSFLCVFFLSPLLPLSLGIFLSPFKIHIVNKKPFFQYLFVLVPSFFIGFLVFMGSNSELGVVNEKQVLSQLLHFGHLFYFYQMAKSLTCLFPCGMIFISASLLCFVLSFFFASSRFSQDFRAYHAIHTSKKVSSSLPVQNKVHTPLIALYHREIGTISQSNGMRLEWIMEMILPLFLLFFLNLGGGLSFVYIKADASLVNLILFAIISFLSALCFISASSVSREGKTFVLDTIFPLRSTSVIGAKALFHFVFATIPYFLYLFILLYWQGNDDGSFALYCLIFVINSFSMCFWDLAIDYRNPYLNWDLPIQAMKSNVNVLFSLFVNVGCVLMSIGLLYYLKEIPLLVLLCSLVHCVVGYHVCMHMVQKQRGV